VSRFRLFVAGSAAGSCATSVGAGWASVVEAMVAGSALGRRAAGGIEWDRGWRTRFVSSPWCAVLEDAAAESAGKLTRADGDAARRHHNYLLAGKRG
jgi:hypothetical protein